MSRPAYEEELAGPDERTLGRVLRRRAGALGDRPYVVTEEATWTFGDIDRWADRFAGGLGDLGVGRGDTVALLADASAELIALTFGVNRLGAIWVPTNLDYRGEWLRQSLADSRARVLVVDAQRVPRVREVVEQAAEAGEKLPLVHAVVAGAPGEIALGQGISVQSLAELAEARGPVHEVGVHYADTAAVLWTSGTTGRAKGVMQSHNAWVRAALSGAASAQTRSGDVLYCCLPLYNSAAWVGSVFRALVAGVPVALDRQFSVRDFWERTRRFGATQTFTLGSMHMFLWQAPERPDDRDNPVRSMGAIPLPDGLMTGFKERFGIDIIQQGYGQSEVMGLISRVDDGRTAWNPGSVGKAMDGVEVRMLDDDDREVPVGAIGEFCARPTEPHVLFNGYFHDPEATVAAFRNLWYHTGDLGRVDADGQYHFVDRKKDHIRFKGRSVSSLAVEAVLLSHPAVAQASAFGVPTAALPAESEVMVAVVLRRGAVATPEELARHVNDHAPHFLVPRYIDIVEEVPQTPTAKVQKYLLRQRGVTETTWDRDASGFRVER